MAMVINPASVSNELVLQDLLNYINAKPATSRWKDLFDSSAGRVIVELIAGLGVYTAYNTITSRRETYLEAAVNRSSCIGAAKFLGYSVSRGTNAHLTLTITPNVTTTFDKWDVLGTVKDTTILAAENLILNEGIETTINVIIGSTNEESVTASTDGITIFRFTSTSVSNDLRLYLNDTELTFTSAILDLVDGGWVAISNAYGAVDVMNLNSGTYTYVAGDTIKINYVNLYNLSFVLADLNFNYGDISSFEYINTYEEPETKDNVKVNAPLYHETQYVVRAREDYPKILGTLSTDIISTNHSDLSPAIVKVSYVLTDLTLLSSTAKEAYITTLSKNRAMGVAPCVFVDPIKKGLNLYIKIYLIVDSDASTVTTDTATILANYQKILGQSVNFRNIEKAYEDLDYVKVARISFNTGTTWLADTSYKLSNIVIPNTTNGFIYEAIAFIKESSSTEPTWPTVYNGTVIDGGVEWVCLPIDGTPSDWAASTSYSIGSQVLPMVHNGFMYEVQDFVFYSGSSEPTWPTISGTEVKDNNLVWVAMAYSGTPSAWSDSTRYKKGDIVKDTSSTSPTLMFQCIDYCGISGSSEPTWPTTEAGLIIDNELKWKCRLAENNPDTLGWNEYYVASYTITLVSEDN